jgi:hypothetical protein
MEKGRSGRKGTAMKSDLLAYWINERYSIMKKKTMGQVPPWTADADMAGVRWCNVHREDDAVTVWMAREWRYAAMPMWWSVLGRMLNYTPTLNNIISSRKSGYHMDIPNIRGILKARRERGEKVFTSAYTISTCGKKMDKIDYVMEVVQAFMEAGEPEYDNLAETYKQITCVDGFGSFLAGQVLADCKNTPGHPLTNAPDWHTWCSPGPGSLRGLSALYGSPVTPSGFQRAIAAAWAETAPLINPEIPPIHMQDFQNCLCEFSKMMRIKYGDKRVRNRYAPD